MDYENDKDAEDAMEALKGKNMGGRSLNIGKTNVSDRFNLVLLYLTSLTIFDANCI